MKVMAKGEQHKKIQWPTKMCPQEWEGKTGAKKKPKRRPRLETETLDILVSVCNNKMGLMNI